MAGLDEGQSPEREDLLKLDFNDKVARAFKDNKPILLLYLRCTECVIGMTGSVDGFDSEFRTKVRETDRKQGIKEANELFLERLEMCAEKSKWRLFLNVLSQLEYEMIYKLLIGEPITRDRERYVKLVEILTPFLKSQLAPLQLIDDLLEEGCLNDQDKQNIQQEVKNHGDMEGTLLLLSRITRLKDDWFRGFMTALCRNNQITLMREIDPDFTEKMLNETGSRSSELSLDTESNPMSNEKNETETELDDAALVKSASKISTGRCISPTLSPPKQLNPFDYQNELCEPVTGGKNTAIFAPVHSGKQFILLNIIKNHFAEPSEERRVVLVVFPTATRAQRFVRRCEVFLNHLTTSLVTCYPPDREQVDNCDVLVHSLDSPLCVSSEYGYDIQYTLLLFELPPTAMCDEQQDLDRYTSLVGPIEECPQVVVVVSRHVNYESYFVDSIVKAIQVFALFCVERIAIVTKHLSSLSEQCVIDRRPVGSRSDNYVVVKILLLIDKVEKLIKEKQQQCSVQNPDHPLCKMSELASAPLEKTSVLYMAWFKTNFATLNHMSAGSCGVAGLFNILKVLHSALLINSEARSQDALQYITARLKSYNVPTTIKIPIQETITYMENNCSETQDDPIAKAVRQKLVELFSDDGINCKVVVLLRHPIALSYLQKWLTSDEVLKDVDFILKSHQKDLPDFADTVRNKTRIVLLTTSSLLIGHIPDYPWDCIIRTDFTDSCLMSWAKIPNVRAESEVYPVNFMMNLEFEKCLWEINDLRMNKEDEFQRMLRNQRTIEQEKRIIGYGNIPVFAESVTDFYCHGCGQFLCNEANVRRLNDMWLALDEDVLHRAKFASHPNPVVFGQGCAKLARFICKDCGQKWGIITHFFGKSYLALAKEGLDISVEGKLQAYVEKWRLSNVNIIPFHYEHDAWRCVPSTLCINGQPISALLKSLYDEHQLLSADDRDRTSCIDNRHVPDVNNEFKFGYKLK